MTTDCSCDVCIFAHSTAVDFSTLPVIPTVCLISVGVFGDEFRNLILKCLAIGTFHFASCGEMANVIEDEIDSILESGEDDWLDVVTTAHENELLEDIVYFLIRPACINGGIFRLLIIDSCQSLNTAVVLKEVGQHCAKITNTIIY